MPNPPKELWTADEIAAHCRRFGLSLPEPLMKRMHELSANVSQTGMDIARMPSKDCEPALTFKMPVE
ncbi:hypothetical protein [Bordetella genomosp. 13]|uniref:Uncharacterized protein n=1 Tax=Bordetella genomosp. 13 TaxID=463040 RepID=A0A1W6ZK58_9BORD|nr:hypothetical protein [Bordetella genomosp. 13]ARP97184.1 hypothetical protein CAL15_24125 [Bordetella genomosp. 13]